MTSLLRTLSLAFVASMLCGSVAMAQSLADVARREEARRKEIKQSGKVYTNKDLGDVPVLPAQAASAEQTPPPAESPSDAARTDEGAKDQTKDTSVKKDQAYWSKRAKDLASQLSRDQTFADALQTKVNSLTADFSARDDPAQRAQIGRERQRVLDELDRLKKTVQDDKKAIADLQEEARRAAVPPGWLR
jgi:hypothetical protein